MNDDQIFNALDEKKQVCYTCFKFGFETTDILARFAVIKAISDIGRDPK